MGSSKKHKEKDKDRDREHKHKRKHRSRSREKREKRDKDRSSKHESKRRKTEKESSSSRLESSRKSEAVESRYQDDVDVKYQAPDVDLLERNVASGRRNQDVDSSERHASSGKRNQAPDADPSDRYATSEKKNLVLSIEATNELRAKLGLKPLEVDDDSKKKSDDPMDADVHAPPINLAEEKRSSDLREKMAQMREKRRINMLLNKVKPITAEDSDDDDSAFSWVMKCRKADEERKKAEQTAKLLEDLDKEFGVGNLVVEEFGSKKSKGYGAKDLKGMKIEHSQEGFVSGKNVILTLKDKGVLDEEDDVLINVNMIDDEKAAKNVENKKKKPDYKPYDEPEMDEYGMLRPKEILEKYDEEIEGQKREHFTIGSGGRYEADHERRMDEIRSKLREQQDTLSLAQPTLATEFYTATEMESFKKTKKKKVRTLRKKNKILKADDLLETLPDDEVKREVDPEDVEVKMDLTNPIPGLDLIQKIPLEAGDMDDDDDDFGPDEDLTGLTVEEDKAQLELELALNKARKIKSEKKAFMSTKLETEEMLQAEAWPYKESTFEFGKTVTVLMNSTSEFCRSLGEIPTYGLSGNREDGEEDMEFEQTRKVTDPDDDEQGTGWQSVEIDTRPVDIKTDDKPVLDDEPIVNQGIGAALKLAGKKGYLESQAGKVSSAPRHTTLQAQNYSIEDKKYDDLDEKYRKRDRYSGGVTMDFKEKEGYKPEIKLEYVDEVGREMSKKEAFRYLSHRFHGKGSGKKKTEKRMNKVNEELLMRSMSSTDTPLNTVHLLQEKQRLNKTPYVILSGGKGIAANNIAK